MRKMQCTPTDRLLGLTEAFIGRTMARLLKQLRPSGGRLLRRLDGVQACRRRLGFVEISKDNEQNRPTGLKLCIHLTQKVSADCGYDMPNGIV
jgi:hypothetical protein